MPFSLKSPWIPLAVAGLSWAAQAGADPLQVSHSGRLLSGSDEPVQGAARLSFRLYDAPTGGTLAWAGTDCDVELKQGHYSVVLGSVGAGGCGSGLTTDLWPATATRYLEVSLGSVTLLPRQALSPVPVAASAARALVAESLSAAGQAALDSRFVRLQGSVQTGTVQVSGDIVSTSGRFTGSGAGLTQLDAAQLATGTVADARLGSNVVRLDGSGKVPLSQLPTQIPDPARLTSTDTQTFAGTVAAPSFTGSGAGLTQLPAAQLTGTLPASVLGGGSTSITTLGTITTGTWAGSVIGSTYVQGLSSKLDTVAHNASLTGTGAAAAPLGVVFGTGAGTAAEGNDARFSSLAASVTALQQDVALIKNALGPGSLVNPAASCKALRTAAPSTPSGVYWLRPDGVTTAFQAYCNMSDAGGGWTLVLRLGASTSAYQPNEAMWESATTQNESDFNLSSSSTSKYPSYTTVPFGEVYFKMGNTGYSSGFAINTAATSMMAAQQRAWGATENRSLTYKSSDYRSIPGADPGQQNNLGTESYLMGWSLKQDGHYSGGSSGGRVRVGSILDEQPSATDAQAYGNAGSGYGIGACGGNPQKFTSSGYCGWSVASCFDAYPALVYVR